MQSPWQQATALVPLQCSNCTTEESKADSHPHVYPQEDSEFKRGGGGKEGCKMLTSNTI